MVKDRDDVKEWQRALLRLSSTAGALVHAAEGAVLVAEPRVADPEPLLRACLRGARPTVQELRTALGQEDQLHVVTRRWLGGAHHDLRVVEVAAGGTDVKRKMPRLYRRYGAMDAAWCQARRDRLVALAQELDATRVTWPEPDARLPPWFAQVLVLVAELHGKAAAQTVSFIANTMARRPRERNLVAMERLQRLLELLPDAGASAPEPWLREALEDARRARRMQGRARERLLRRVLRAVLDMDVPDPGVPAPGASVEERLRALAELTFQAPGPGNVNEVALVEALARWALCFRATTDVPALEDLERAAGNPARLRQLAGRDLTLDQALRVLRLESRQGDLGQVARLVAEGLELAWLEAAAAVHPLEDLEGDVNTVRAWCQWVSRLVPHFQEQGVRLHLPFALFAPLRGTRRDELGLLLHCLMRPDASAAEDAPDDAMAALGATLALFNGVPRQVHAILARLEGTSPGLGRRTHAAFAEWLADDTLMDRYLHLCVLAGEPGKLSRALLEDFTRADKVRLQVEHLQDVAHPSEKQARQLLKLMLAHDSDEDPTPQRTRRRMADRVQELLRRAWERQRDELMRTLVQQTWGISLPRMTPAWRLALQFHLHTLDNRGWLAQLLRFTAAHPGVLPARLTAENRCWLDQAAGYVNVDAWLAGFRQDVNIGDKTLSLSLEADPLEALQMGVPFKTCLSLEDGCNAASAVLNALEPNKRVLYVRDAQGTVLARKLLGITPEWKLVGYRLYHNGDRALAVGLAGPVRAYCAELARACGIPLGDHGTPKQLHPGFWYDDGEVPFSDAPPEDRVAGYCAFLGRPVPAVVAPELVQEAAQWGRWQERDLEACLQHLGSHAVLDAVVLSWTVNKLGEERALRQSNHCRELGAAALRALARRSPREWFRLVAPRPVEWWVQEPREALQAHLPRPEHLEAWLAAAGQAPPPAPGCERALAHFLGAAPLLACLPLGDAFNMLDRMERLEKEHRRRSPECGVDWPAFRGALLARLPRGLDVAATLAALVDARRGTQSRLLALHVAARFTLVRGTAARRVRRGLDALARTVPGLDGSPWLYAARVRHTPKDELGQLPPPGTPPWEALGELVFQLDPALLEPWSRSAGPAGSWTPGPWELAYRRHHPGRVRPQLVKEALRAAGSLEHAVTWLAELGCVEDLEQVASARPDAASLVAGTLGLARAVRREAAGTEPERPVKAGRRVDGRQWAGLRTALQQGASPAEMDRVVQPLLGSSPELPDMLAILAEAADLALPAARAAVEPLLHPWFSRLPRGFLEAGILGVRELVRLWQWPGLQAALLPAFINAFDDDWETCIHALGEAAREAGQPFDPEELLARWFLASDQPSLHAQLEAAHPDSFARAAGHLAREASPAAWMAWYQRVFDAWGESLLLDALQQAPAGKRRQLVDLVANMDVDPLRPHLKQWLVHALV